MAATLTAFIEMSAKHPNHAAAVTQLKAAADAIEAAVKNRALLAELSVEERTRLLKAAGEIYSPDVRERRRLVKAKVKQRKAEKLHRDQSKLHQTGMRKLRRERVFTTPNVFPGATCGYPSGGAWTGRDEASRPCVA